MNSLEKTALVIEALNTQKIPYMLTGSLASNMYGIVRATLDADFVVQIDAPGIARIAQHLAPFFTLDPQVSFETITMTTKYVMVSEDGELKAELFLLSDDAHDQERFRRRRGGTFLGRTAYVPSPEDVIISKLRWYKRAHRQKDIQDVRNVISVQRDSLDRAYLDHWCGIHETRELLEEIMSTLPEKTPERDV